MELYEVKSGRAFFVSLTLILWSSQVCSPTEPRESSAVLFSITNLGDFLADDKRL
jgi:hypothetical protein